MRSALIGYTGFVGSNIANQTSFTDLYNSQNSQDIHDKQYDLIVSAGVSGLMWKANQEPETDKANIQLLINNLKTVTAKHFVLISTIEVYNQTYDIDESTDIDSSLLQRYGLHRLQLEEFIKGNFEKHTIIRLPTLFGEGLKKNFIYDLIHKNRWDLTDKDSKLQWYNLVHIWKDIQIAINHNISLINFAVEPITCAEVASFTLGLDFTTITQNPPRRYDMHSQYARFYDSNTQYLYNKQQTLKELKLFIQKEINK